MTMTDLKPLLALLNITFNDEKLLHQALVHRSSLNEYKNSFSVSNERCRFRVMDITNSLSKIS